MKTKSEWSRTQKSLFLQCPRAWYLQYGETNKQFSNRRNLSSQRPWNLMLRAIQDTMMDQLDDLHQGKEWSRMLIQHQLRSNLNENTKNSIYEISPRKRDALLKFANNRYAGLWRTRILRELKARKHPQWHTFDRREPVNIEGNLLFIAPDLVVRVQNKWHLFRFDMQSSRENICKEEEANAMAIWAIQHGGFHSSPSAFKLHTIGWLQGYWQQNTFEPSTSSVSQCQRLLTIDMKAMKGLRDAGNHNLALIPLARHHRTCQTCAFRKSCPGGNDLVDAKKEQTLLELSLRNDY